MTECSSLRLKNGDLEFTALSCGQGPLVIFLHGFPDLPDTWENQMDAVSRAGYRAVAVTSRGYEESSQPPDDNYQLTALAGDVLAWITDLGEERAHLVGHDWGAVIAYASAALQPQRFYSLCTLAVPHSGRFGQVMISSGRQLWLSRYAMFFQLKGIAEKRLRKQRYAFVDRLWRRWSPDWSYEVARTGKIRDRFAVPGVLEATLAYYRQATDGKSVAGVASRELAERPVTVPTLAVHGERDGCVDPQVFKNSMLDKDFPGGLTIKTLNGAGHFLQLEAPGEVNDLLIDWLRANTV